MDGLEHNNISTDPRKTPPYGFEAILLPDTIQRIVPWFERHGNGQHRVERKALEKARADRSKVDMAFDGKSGGGRFFRFGW